MDGLRKETGGELNETVGDNGSEEESSFQAQGVINIDKL